MSEPKNKSPFEKMKKCLGRLTNWDKTSFRIDSCFTVSQAYQCGNKTDEELCKRCLDRPREGKYQTRILHGLITEPIPLISNIYGSFIYWQKLKKFEESGKTLSIDALKWIEMAESAQKKMEEQGGWKVQRPSTREIEKEMRKAEQKKKVVPTKTMKEIFKPVEVKYREVDKMPAVLETDSVDLCKKVLGGITVWIADEFVFDTNSKGEVGDHIGYLRNGEFEEC